MESLVGYVLAALAALTLLTLLRGREFRDRDLPLLAAAIGGALAVAYGGGSETRLWGLAAVAYGFLAYLVTSMQWVRGGGIAEGMSKAPLACLALLFAWCVSVDLAVGLSPDRHLTSYLVIACAIAATGLVVAHGGVDPASAARAGLVVVALSDILGLVSADPWRACDRFKCSSLGGLFRGPYPSENSLALIAVMTLAWTVTSTRGRSRALGTTLCLATVFATGSRTGLAVSVLALAVVAASSAPGPWIRLFQRPRIPWAAALGVPLAIAGVGLYLLYHAGANAFSNRGEVWALALHMVDGHRIVGVGLSSYSVLQDQGLVSQHFTHSEYLLVLFAGGYVGLAFFVLWGAVSIRSLVRARGAATAAVPVVAFLTYGLTEATWNPLAFDSFAWIAMALVITNPSLGVARELDLVAAPLPGPAPALELAT